MEYMGIGIMIAIGIYLTPMIIGAVVVTIVVVGEIVANIFRR